jgi:hypothetical protein
MMALFLGLFISQTYAAEMLGFKVTKPIPSLTGVEIYWDIYAPNKEIFKKGLATLGGASSTSPESAAQSLANHINSVSGLNIATATGDTVFLTGNYRGVSYFNSFTTRDYFKLVGESEVFLSGKIGFEPGLNGETFLTESGTFVVEGPGVSASVFAPAFTTIDELGFLLWQNLPSSMFSYAGDGKINFNIPSSGTLSFSGSGAGLDLVLTNSVPEQNSTLLLLASGLVAVVFVPRNKKLA